MLAETAISGTCYTFSLPGSDLDSQHAIPDERVSKQHFRIYSVIYEAKSTDLPPLVYCEDLESFNGTYVNDVLIGEIARERVGRLLCDGDLIEIRPFWKFRFYQPDHRCVFPSMTQEHDQRVRKTPLPRIEPCSCQVVFCRSLRSF